jgi:hypothetical protein
MRVSKKRKAVAAATLELPHNPILDLPLTQVMRSEIALPLQQVFHVYTVGSFLNAWGNPKNQPLIEQVFDNPEQAHHAVATCAAWLGMVTPASPASTIAESNGWWVPGNPNSNS